MSATASRSSNVRHMASTILALSLSGSGTLAVATEIEDFVSQELRELSATPVQSSVATVIGQICPSGTIITDPDLQDRCNEIAVAGVVDPSLEKFQGVRDALQAMAAEEGAAVASSLMDATGGNSDAVGQRMNNVRGGIGAAGGVVYKHANGFDWTGGAAGDGSGSPWGFFVSGLYAHTDRDTTARESGFKGDDYGVTAGVDYTFDGKVLVGAAFGYKDANADIDNNSGKLETKSYSFFGYWSLFPDDYWFIDGMVGYTDNDHDQKRNIRYTIAALGGGTTTVNNSAVSGTDSDEWSVSVAAGRNFFLGNWVAAPTARIDYADTEIDGFTETMAQPGVGSGLALNIDGQRFKSLMLAAGGTLTTEIKSSVGSLFPQLTAEYVHEFKNSNDPMTGRFVNDSSATTIVLLADSPDRNFFNIGAGVTAAFSDMTSGFFRYQALLGYRNLDVHVFEVGVRATF